jgi:hypothetical protein
MEGGRRRLHRAAVGRVWMRGASGVQSKVDEAKERLFGFDLGTKQRLLSSFGLQAQTLPNSSLPFLSIFPWSYGIALALNIQTPWIIPFPMSFRTSNSQVPERIEPS